MRHGWIMGLAVLSLVAGCGTPDPEDERPVPPAPTLPSGALPTEPTTIAPSTTTTVVEQSTTDFPTSTEATTTTTVVDEVVALRPDGIGQATFGQDAETALAYLTSRLGEPNADSGWVAAATSPFGVCPGTEVRGLRWGPLQVLVGDQGTAARQLFTWVYAVALLPAEEPQSLAAGLQTTEGIGLGSSIADLAAVYPELQVDTDAFGPTYNTGGPAGFSGTISSEGPDGFVTSIVGGTYCGE